MNSRQRKMRQRRNVIKLKTAKTTMYMSAM